MLVIPKRRVNLIYDLILSNLNKNFLKKDLCFLLAKVGFWVRFEKFWGLVFKKKELSFNRGAFVKSNTKKHYRSFLFMARFKVKLLNIVNINKFLSHFFIQKGFVYNTQVNINCKIKVY